VVLEVSSFQADLLDAWRPHAAALLNLAPDHIAHHGDFASYIAAKARLLQGPGLAVIGADDPESRAVAQTIRDRRVVPISGTGPVPGGVYATPEGALMDARGGEPVQIADLAPIKALTGAHNWQNAAAAAALALSVEGVEPSALAAGLATWPGLPHRQFRVREIGPVAYINDSKATNVDAAARALASFADIYWIAGGAARDCDLGPLAPHLGAVRRAFLIGASAPALSAFLSAHGVGHEVSGTLGAAVAAAHATAQGAGGTVVLAPSYQSFDQFTSFEDRGEQFCALVDRL
jgi:UDP-N-acetylmuramoylalanine--D-glutamate ligase